MISQRVEFVELVHAIGDRVGERIFLRIQSAGLDHGDGFGEVHAQRDGAEQFEGALMDLARQHADAHAFEVGGQMHGPEPVGDVAEAVLEPAEDAVADALFGLAHEISPKLAVHRRARLRVRRK